jgi:hypothetical protein
MRWQSQIAANGGSCNSLFDQNVAFMTRNLELHYCQTSVADNMEPLEGVHRRQVVLQ